MALTQSAKGIRWHKHFIIAISVIFTLLFSGCSTDYSDQTTNNEVDVHIDSESSFVSESNDYTYVINTNTYKFHSPMCSSLRNVNANNLEYTDSEANVLMEKGYVPCGLCKPAEYKEPEKESDAENVFTPDKDANKIITSYNEITNTTKIANNHVSWENTAGGYHTYIEKDGIKYDICYADGFYIQMYASNVGVSEDAFIQDMISFLGALIGTTNAQQRINESVQSGDIVKQGYYTIKCSGQSFSLSDDSWG